MKLAITFAVTVGSALAARAQQPDEHALLTQGAARFDPEAQPELVVERAPPCAAATEAAQV